MAETTIIRKRGTEATKTRILLAAIRHFGEHGYEGASLRNILSDADASLASANYHFGSKAKLLEAAIDRYVLDTRERRFDLLAEAEKAPLSLPRIRALTEAYIRPHIEIVIGDRQHDYGRLVFRIAADSGSSLLVHADRALVPVRRRFRDALRVCAPDIDETRLAAGVGFVVSVLAMAPFDMNPKSLTVRTIREAPVAAVLEMATAFAYGGLVQILGVTGETAPAPKRRPPAKKR